MTHIPDEAVEAAERAYETFGAGMRDALEAALPYLACSCFVISDVNDHCPQHGRDS
jgi:hypothetical protein